MITNFLTGPFFSMREAGRGTLMLPVVAAPSSCGPSLVMPVTWVWDVYPSLPLPFINLSWHSPRKWVRRSVQKIFDSLNSTKNYSFQTILKNLFVRRWGVRKRNLPWRPMKGAFEKRNIMEEIIRFLILLILVLQLAVMLRMSWAEFRKGGSHPPFHWFFLD